MNRRRFLAAIGVSGLAGCLDAGGGTTGGDTTAGTADGASDGGDGDGSGSGTGGSGTGGTGVFDHPAGAGIRDQPRRGEFGGHVILTFEDPSCSRCAAFERNTVPKLRENLVETGKAALVFRNYPVVYPWGKPATQALEATFARDEDAFWALADHYFSTQGEFSTDNVYDRTASFLDSETNLDGAAVAKDAREKAYDDAVQADIAAAEAANLSRTTPIVLLFRDGEYVTKASGSVSYDLIASTLGEA
jgi:hypothetical protein